MNPEEQYDHILTLLKTSDLELWQVLELFREILRKHTEEEIIREGGYVHREELRGLAILLILED